jgi:serine protease
LADGYGPSLELCDPNGNNNNGANWRDAIEFQAINATGDSIWASPLAGCSSPPVADFIASNTSIVQGETVTFTNTSSSNATSWYWTFESGIPATFNGENPPPVLYNDMGSFDVTLKVTNLAGENTLVKTNYIEVGFSGLPGISGQKGIQIYPNPTKSAFTLHFDGELNALVRILDQLGNSVFEQEVDQHNSLLNPSGLASGLYFIQVTCRSGEIKTSKLIIQ